MQTINSSDTPCLKAAEQRAWPRAEVALPILIAFGGTRYSGLLHNLSITGAMIESTAPLEIHSKIEFHCGSICNSGSVLRQAGTIFGIKFSRPISDRQLSEQVSRSKGVTNWRERRAITCASKADLSTKFAAPARTSEPHRSGA